VVFATAIFAVLLLIRVGFGLWKDKVMPWVQARLEATLGHKVRVGRLGLGGFRVLVARDVEVLGSPPFDSEPLARADQVTVRLGGPDRGFWDPSGVTIDGLDLEYLSTGTADNLRGKASSNPPKAPAAGMQVPRKSGLELLIRKARVHGAMVLPGGYRMGFRSPDVTMERSPQGQESTRVRNLVIDLGPPATVHLPELSIKSEHGVPVSATGKAGVLAIPGGGALVQDVTFEARFEGPNDTLEVRSGEEAASGLRISYRNTPDLTNLQIELRDLPLRALDALTNPRGVGLEHARADMRAVVSLDREKPGVPFQVDALVRGVELRNPGLDRSAWPDLGGEFHARGQIGLNNSRLEIENAELRALGAQFEVRGWTEFLGAPKGEISIRTPTGAPLKCTNLLAAQALPVRKVLDGLSLGGRLGASLSITFDAAAWETLNLDVNVSPRCMVRSEPQVLSNLAPTLMHGSPVAQAMGLPLGKYHPDFTPLSEMPKHLPAAFLTSEDSRFYSHNGFDVEMIRHALVQDLQTRSFGRGASTITQQLAKNLFLTQHRNLARKLEETVLAWRLHNLVGKDRILELYLNVIDLGPGIRGVRQASRAYFGKEPAELRPIESAYLATLTPNPHVLERRFRDGQVDDGWQQRLYDLLAMMKRSGRLSSAELATARNTRLTLHKTEK
jgi:hypothetical protein